MIYKMEKIKLEDQPDTSEVKTQKAVTTTTDVKKEKTPKISMRNKSVTRKKMTDGEILEALGWWLIEVSYSWLVA